LHCDGLGRENNLEQITRVFLVFVLFIFVFSVLAVVELCALSVSNQKQKPEMSGIFKIISEKCD